MQFAWNRRSIVCCPECADPFGVRDLDHHLFYGGGVPEPLLAMHKDAEFLNEWIDSFYACDILKLFGICKHQGFLSHPALAAPEWRPEGLQ